MLLQWLGKRHDLSNLSEAADSLEQAVDHCLTDAKTRTQDLGGTLSTTAFTGAVIAQLDKC